MTQPGIEPRSPRLLGVMAMKGYTILSISSEPKPHHQMQFSIILRTMYFFFVGEGISQQGIQLDKAGCYYSHHVLVELVSFL